MKRNGFFLILIAAFVLGAIGHIFLRPQAQEKQAYTLLLRSESFPLWMCYALPEENTDIMLGKQAATVEKTEILIPYLDFREGGETIRTPSKLHRTVFFTVRAEGYEKEGRLYVGDLMLTMGTKVSIVGENFAFSSVLWDFEAVF